MPFLAGDGKTGPAEPAVWTFLPTPNGCNKGALIRHDSHNLCFLKMSFSFLKAPKYENEHTICLTFVLTPHVIKSYFS